jgi:hypothetical protein
MSNPVLQAVKTAFAAAAGATVSGAPPVAVPVQQPNLGGSGQQSQGIGGGGNNNPSPTPPSQNWSSYNQWTQDFQSDTQQNNFLTAVGWTFGDTVAPVIVDDLANIWDLFTVAFPTGTFLVIGTAQNASSGANSVSLCAANATSGVLQSIAEVDSSLIVTPQTSVVFPVSLLPSDFQAQFSGIAIN